MAHTSYLHVFGSIRLHNIYLTGIFYHEHGLYTSVLPVVRFFRCMCKRFQVLRKPIMSYERSIYSYNRDEVIMLYAGVGRLLPVLYRRV
jgi:hypothetical protein